MTLAVFHPGYGLYIDSASTTELVQHRVSKWSMSPDAQAVAVMIGQPMIANALMDWWLGCYEGKEVAFPKAAKLGDNIAELVVMYASAPTNVSRYTVSSRPERFDHSCAFGVGMDFAYGALFASASPAMAMQAAAYYSPYVAAPFHNFTESNGFIKHTEVSGG